MSTPHTDAVRPRCEGCGREIDPDCCGCGDPIQGHGIGVGGHGPIPMGCACFRDNSQADEQVSK